MQKKFHNGGNFVENMANMKPKRRFCGYIAVTFKPEGEACERSRLIKLEQKKFKIM